MAKPSGMIRRFWGLAAASAVLALVVIAACATDPKPRIPLPADGTAGGFKSEPVSVFEIKDKKGNVTKVDNLTLPDVSKTTVYFTDAPGEHETADAVGQLLKADVAPRTKEVADQPPGVIVVVTG